MISSQFTVHRSRKYTERGQILVILLLVMMVGLTVGLFTLGRTTTDIGVSTRVTESSRAFNAAEAGIEEAIRLLPSDTVTSNYAPGITYTVEPENLGDTTNLYPGVASEVDTTEVGGVLTVWLVPHVDATNELDLVTYTYAGNELNICFINSQNPAFTVTLYYLDGSEIKSSQMVYNDDENADITGADNTSETTTAQRCGGTSGFNRRFPILLGSHFGAITMTKPVAIRIKVMLNASELAVDPDPTNGTPALALPKQGNKIESTGVAGEIVRKLEVDETYTEPAPFMDHVLFSRESDLSK